MKKDFFKHLPKSRYFEIVPKFQQERVQNYTTLVLTIIALIFFGLFAINPTISTITNLQRQLDDSRLVYQKLSEKRANLLTLQQAYTSLENDLPYLFAAIPEKPTLTLLIGQLQALAKDKNLTLSRIQTYQIELTKENDASLKYSSFAFAVDLEGTYEQLSQFISDIARTERILIIDTLSISAHTEKKGLLVLNIRGKAYFKR